MNALEIFFFFSFQTALTFSQSSVGLFLAQKLDLLLPPLALSLNSNTIWQQQTAHNKSKIIQQHTQLRTFKTSWQMFGVTPVVFLNAGKGNKCVRGAKDLCFAPMLCFSHRLRLLCGSGKLITGLALLIRTHSNFLSLKPLNSVEFQPMIEESLKKTTLMSTVCVRKEMFFLHSLSKSCKLCVAFLHSAQKTTQI